MANKKIREKKKNQPEPFQVVLPSIPYKSLPYTVKESLPYTVICGDTGGEYTGTVDGHSTVILDVVCMPFQTGNKNLNQQQIPCSY